MKRVRNGFTLLEVLVATAILGVAVVTLLGLHARNVELAAEAADLTAAGALAGDVLAASRLDRSLEQGSSKGSFAAGRDDADGRRVLYGGPGSERFAWERDVMPTALPTLRQVRVRVRRVEDERVITEMWAALRAGSRP